MGDKSLKKIRKITIFLQNVDFNMTQCAACIGLMLSLVVYNIHFLMEC